jgi:hypothetical protein
MLTMFSEDGLAVRLLEAAREALQVIETDLAGAYALKTHERYAQLLEFIESLDTRALMVDGADHIDAWRLTLAYLPRPEQQRLQVILEGLQELAAEEADSGIVVSTLDGVQQLLSELSFTTIEPPGRGADDHDERRERLRVEVKPGFRVAWYDGYQTSVACMSAVVDETLYWELCIEAPPPESVERRTIPVSPGSERAIKDICRSILSNAGRDAYDPSGHSDDDGVLEGPSDDFWAASDWELSGYDDEDGLLRRAVEKDLDAALVWAADELGEHYDIDMVEPTGSEIKSRERDNEPA